MEFNASVFSAERANYYRCLQTLLLLSQEEERQPLQYLNAFIRMYGADAVEAASAALSGEAPFYGLQAVDSDLQAFPAHQSLLKAYENCSGRKRRFGQNKPSLRHRSCSQRSHQRLRYLTQESASYNL